MAERIRRAGLLALVVPLVGCDHGTKWVAKGALEGRPPHQLLSGVLDLQYAENFDVAFNLLRWIPERARGVLLLVTGAVAVLALLAALLRSRERWTRVALLLIAAGALGNYLDRLARGYVVDFVHLSHWPVFNVADAYVVAGAALLAWGATRARAVTSPSGWHGSPPP
jgi:signal peptidase II